MGDEAKEKPAAAKAEEKKAKAEKKDAKAHEKEAKVDKKEAKVTKEIAKAKEDKAEGKPAKAKAEKAKAKDAKAKVQELKQKAKKAKITANALKKALKAGSTSDLLQGIDLSEQINMGNAKGNYGIMSIFLVLIFGLALGYVFTKLIKKLNSNFNKTDNIRYTQPANVEMELKRLVSGN